MLHFSEHFFFSSGSVRLSCEERVRGSAELTNLCFIIFAHRVGEAGLFNIDTASFFLRAKKFILNEAGKPRAKR